MRIAVLQAHAVPGQVGETLARIAGAARRAAAAGAELLVTPELFTTGYAPALVPGILRETSPEDIVRRLAEVAASCGVALVASAPERASTVMCPGSPGQSPDRPRSTPALAPFRELRRRRGIIGSSASRAASRPPVTGCNITAHASHLSCPASFRLPRRCRLLLQR
ncbi:nitrilase-related carbon-nitrogen hydrolase [Sorangium sp. So ce321]|uniref:nitrilase-related carbon-nitrogen hydrolase n=1 Tax=Sorangium sp. So ce321 TaxID=3133300 RepID=UPI003F622237